MNGRSKHLFTPGPWLYRAAVDQPDGFWIGNKHENAAYVPGFTDHPGNIANARLVSCAPTMLSELQQCVVELEEAANLLRPTLRGMSTIYDAAALRVRAAISKATGASK